MSADAIARARQLEADGDVDGAAREFALAGAHQEAARVLSMALRPIDAALALLSGIEMISADAPPEARDRMKVAASLLREGDRDEHARLILAALGGGTAFPAAVLKSTATAMRASERTSSAPPAARASVAPGARASVAPGARASVAPAGVPEPRASVPPGMLGRSSADPPLAGERGQSSSPFLTRVRAPRPDGLVDSATDSQRARRPVVVESQPGAQGPVITESRPGAGRPSITESRPGAERPSITESRPGAERPSITESRPGALRPLVAESQPGAPRSLITESQAGARRPSLYPDAGSTPGPGASAQSRPAAQRPASDSPSAPRASVAPDRSNTTPAQPASAHAAESAAPAERARAPRPAPSPSDPESDRYKAEGGWRNADAATTERAITQFLEGGRKGAAARVAWEAGQHARALEWFVELGLKYQAGSCLRSLGRNAEALAMLLEVPQDDPRYRRASLDVVTLAKELGRLDFEIDRFLSAFVAEGPKDQGECPPYLELAELYASAGFAEGARRCGEGVVRLMPDDARARAFAGAGAPRRARGTDRPERRAPDSAELLSLPTLEEFTALARRHAPKAPAARK